VKLMTPDQHLSRAADTVYFHLDGPLKLPSPDGVLRGWRNMFIPYGKWTCADGREVLFNRHYSPIYQRATATWPCERANQYEWVPFVKQEWFYNDAHTVKQSIKIGLRVLRSWGLHST